MYQGECSGVTLIIQSVCISRLVNTNAQVKDKRVFSIYLLLLKHTKRTYQEAFFYSMQLSSKQASVITKISKFYVLIYESSNNANIHVYFMHI